MPWPTHPTTEMPPLPPPAGRHRRPRLGVVGIVAIVVVLGFLAGGAMIGPTLFGEPAAAPPVLSATATLTPSHTSSPPAAPRTTRPPKTTNAKPKPPPGPTTIAAFEDDVLDLVNAARRARDCRSLKMNSDLRQAARAHSVDMARYKYLSHKGHDGSEPADRIIDAGYALIRSTGWAENIARGYGSPQAVVAGWLDSKDHRDNILNCSFRSTGIGVAKATDGQLYWTQDFGGR